ncbi:MAG: hypothetical protein GY819_13045 [Planctomycetaceae bacterium]|nr:hypothetical protein [Planctomycetaceae bacterium]
MGSHRQLQSEVGMVAEQIARYLESRPNAVDNIEGIVHWWLLKQKIEETTEVVQAAVDTLVNEGVVEKIERNGKAFYTSTRQANSDGTGEELT